MGTPRIPFTRSVRAPAEAEYVARCLAGGRLHGDGEFTHRAHELLKKRLGDVEVLLTTSCTHALELMAVLFELAPGDEVVLPSFTFSSTANAVALRGARIRFADIDPDTWSMELPELEAALAAGPRPPKAAIAMEYGGVCRDLEAMVARCARDGIWLGEDAAHAFFATHGGRPYGTFASVGAFSFHNTKNLSCGEGGAVVMRDRALFERALVLREKGTDRARFLRGEIDKYTWRDVGSSWLPSDLLAAVLVAQLEHADAMQAQRQAAWRAYQQALAPEAARFGFKLQQIPAGVLHPAHVFGLVLSTHEERVRVIKSLAAHGIQAVSHYEPLHVAPAGLRFGDGRALPVTESIAPRLLRLPLSSDLTLDEVHEVVERLLAALRGT